MMNAFLICYRETKPQLDEDGRLRNGMSKNAKSTYSKEDLEWSEVAQLGLRYARIPLALLCMEAFYWFLTQPSDTLAPIQVSEAWIWNELTNLIFGEGASILGTHNGWSTRIELNHSTFPGNFDNIALYVSDECAGVHEMIFLSTLVAMTEGVPQKLKIRSILVMCSIIYILNILRLLVFYPIAVEDCIALPNDPACLQGMWNWHTFVWKYGFLLVIVSMWVAWFWRFGGPARTLDASVAGTDKWRLAFRKKWELKQFYILAGAVFLLLFAVYNVTSNEEAMAAKETLDLCYFSELVTSECGQAQNRWDDAIGYAWSLSALSILALGFTGVVIERPDENGKWPVTQSKESEMNVDAKEPTEPKSRHKKKKSGSWKKNAEEE